MNSSHEPCLILNDFDSFSFNRNLVYATDYRTIKKHLILKKIIIYIKNNKISVKNL